METDGEGAGGEVGSAGRRGRIELRRLLEAIESSEVVGKRIPLVKQLEDSSLFSTDDDLGLILQCLLTSWIDSTCSSVSHCTLHKSILQVALKCSDLDITDYLGQFVILSEKASSWCGKHLQRSVKSIDESQVVQEEEHASLCLEINSLSCILSTKLFGIAAKSLTVLGVEVAAGEGGQGVVQEECVLNKADDAFPTLEAMAVEVETAPAHLPVGVTPWNLAPVRGPLTQKSPRRCTHCGSEKTPRWLRGPDGPRTLCNACGIRYKRRLLPSNSRRCQGSPSKKRRPSKENGNDVAVLVDVPSENSHEMAMASWSPALLPQEVSRRCSHCASEETPRWLWGPNGPNTLCNACGLRFYKGQLLNPYSSRHRGHPSKKCRSSKENGNDVAVLVEVPSENSRRCTHCATEKTPRWLRGPDGPGTLCNACGQRFKKGRLLQSNSRRRRGCRLSGMENSAGSNNLVEALVEAMPCGVGASLDAFFDQTVSEVSWEEAGPERAEDEEELEWLSNKEAFPSLETMAVEVEDASALDTLLAAATIKGRWRVIAVDTCRQADVPPAEKATVVSPVPPRRRCTHCAMEETPTWRVGPEGPYTLCNPCGIVFTKKGLLLPEYRPANSPAFSPLLHSNNYRLALAMHHQNETSASSQVQSELMDGPANDPTSSPLQRNSPLHRVFEERCQTKETSAAGRATAMDGCSEVRHEFMEVPLLPEYPPADRPAFSLMSHCCVLECSRKSEQENFAVIRATAKARGSEHLTAMDN